MAKRKGNCYMNYTGSKARYEKEVLEVIPEELKEKPLKVLDLFGGGASLSTRLPKAWKVTVNDIDTRIIDIHKQMQNLASAFGPEGGLDFVKVFTHFKVPDNKSEEAYLELRDHYNSTPDKHPMVLYSLICSSNSNRVRFGPNGFNVPFGKRYFNPSMQQNLLSWMQRVVDREIEFISMSYDEIDYSEYDIVIFDPPYACNNKSTAVYNESGGWTFNNMIDVLNITNRIANSGKHFIAFNEVTTKGVDNSFIKRWSQLYNCVTLEDTLTGSSANRTKERSVEVLVHNFPTQEKEDERCSS
ncbi:DNA adenine methylase [Pseudoalteromonas phage J2-1_QLiu-2017]|nr:DNA adenine methylase [Pseudoalteromonas phage J2-1_QLiu-2017]